MLTSLFESSIDKLNIPSDMKSAIKQINNICLEAEGDETSKNTEKSVGKVGSNKGMFNQHMSAEEAKARYDAQQKETNAEQVAKNDSKQPTKAKEEIATEKGGNPSKNMENSIGKVGSNKGMFNQHMSAEEAKARYDAQQKEANAEQVAKNDSKQPTTAQQSTTARRGADVATVQYFLQSVLPNSNLVADGILGPKTITAIQQKENIEATGKMDENTKNAFSKLLAEAKKKVIPIQEKLGVTADGLIGKQTLQAMNKANMNVVNVFSKDAKAPQSSPQQASQQASQQAPQQVATKKANVNVLDTPFDAAKAQRELRTNQITKLEYNIWEAYGISPLHQRRNPEETRQECRRLSYLSPAERRQELQERLAKNNPKASQQQQQQQTQGNMTPAARKNSQQKVTNQGNAQSVQNAAPKQKQQKQGAQYLSGTVSYINLPPDEKKVYDEAEKKSLNKNMKWGSGDEQTALNQASMDASVAVLKYRAQKGGNKG